VTDLFPLIAVDVGNARVKFALVESDCGEALPQPSRTLQLSGRPLELERVETWLAQITSAEVSWWIGSVNRSTVTRLVDHVREHRPRDRITMLAAGDLPLAVDVERPDMVGVDRLLDALAANHLRRRDRGAVVVDVGTAITVDAISPEGVFLGGSILPGIAMSARAMHEFTDLLPLVEMSELDSPPPALGAATIPAMQSGLFWGAVGAIRQLIERLAEHVGHDPQIFLTGGAGPAVAELLGRSAQHVPQLTLAGIVLAARAATE
jgi:type III pantothenate kinase